jgi:hypothetical protein
MAAFQSFLVVRGRVASMFDMLRYDQCFPANERQAAAMWESFSTGRPVECVVILTRRAANDNPATADRWRSFNCEVLGQFSAFSDAEALADRAVRGPA